MSAIEQKEFDRNLRPRERHYGFPRLALRQRSADHPMIMFFMIVATAFTAMALLPPAGVTFASFGVSAAVSAPALKAAPAEIDASSKSVGLSETEIACNGQAWGAQTVECLAMIAKESGQHDARKIRVIAGA